MKYINSSPRYKAIGPYSQAVQVGSLLYCSGVIGLNAKGVLVTSLEDQVIEIFENLKSILSQEKLNLSNIIKTTVYLADINDFAIFNQIYANAFGDHRPARSTIQAGALPKNAKVEIEVIVSYT